METTGNIWLVQKFPKFVLKQGRREIAEHDVSFLLSRAETGVVRQTDVTLEEDQWYFLNVPESYGVVVSLLFLFKTSRARTPETPEDYCKLSSGDVLQREVGERREGRYEGPP